MKISKIYLNVQIFLYIIFNFYVVNSFRDSTIVYLLDYIDKECPIFFRD